MAASSSSSLRRAPSVLQGRRPGPRLYSLCMDAGGDDLAGADRAFRRQQASPRASGEASPPVWSECPVQTSLGTRNATPSECLCYRDRRAPRPTTRCEMQGVGWGRGIALGESCAGCSLTKDVFSKPHQPFPLRPTLLMQCQAFFQNSEAGPQGCTTRRYCPPLAEPSIFRRAAPDKRFVSGRWSDLRAHLLQEVWWVRLGRRASKAGRGEVTLEVVFGPLSELG